MRVHVIAFAPLVESGIRLVLSRSNHLSVVLRNLDKTSRLPELPIKAKTIVFYSGRSSKIRGSELGY